MLSDMTDQILGHVWMLSYMQELAVSLVVLMF